MDIHLNYINFLDSIALIQGILLGLIFINSSNKEKPSLFIGLFLITYTLELIDSILMSTGILNQYQELLFLPLNFYYLTVPLLYLYVKRLIMSISLKNVFIVLIPRFVEILVCYSYFLLKQSKALSKVNILMI